MDQSPNGAIGVLGSLIKPDFRSWAHKKSAKGPASVNVHNHTTCIPYAGSHCGVIGLRSLDGFWGDLRRLRGRSAIPDRDGRRIAALTFHNPRRVSVEDMALWKKLLDFPSNGTRLDWQDNGRSVPELWRTSVCG
jgi:hypothetical protein